jgi:hypothetical protein
VAYQLMDTMRNISAIVETYTAEIVLT